MGLPTIEGLEARRLLAGTVQTVFADGVLHVTGDDASNSVLIQRTVDEADPSAVRVMGRDGTQISGVTQQGGFSFSGVREIHLRLNAGDDEVHLVNLRLAGGMNIDPGAGDDDVFIRRSRIFGNVLLGSGRDGDSLSVRDSFFGNDFVVFDKRGPASISLRDSVFDDNLSISTGPEDDRITINNCVTYGFSGFATGDGDDFIRIAEGAEFRQPTALDDGAGEDQVYREVVQRFDFSNGEQGWQFGAANYTLGPGQALEDYRLESGIRLVSPDERSTDEKAYYLRGDNNSDQLFLFISHLLSQEDGIRPDAIYRLELAVTIATDIPANSFNLPERLVVGAVSRPVEVRVLEESLPTGRLIGSDGVSRAKFPEELNVVDYIKNDRDRAPGDQVLPYGSVHYQHEFSADVKPDAAGQLSVIAGMRSDFEGGGAIYIERITVRLRPVA